MAGPSYTTPSFPLPVIAPIPGSPAGPGKQRPPKGPQPFPHPSSALCSSLPAALWFPPIRIPHVPQQTNPLGKLEKHQKQAPQSSQVHSRKSFWGPCSAFHPIGMARTHPRGRAAPTLPLALRLSHISAARPRPPPRARLPGGSASLHRPGEPLPREAPPGPARAAAAAAAPPLRPAPPPEPPSPASEPGSWLPPCGLLRSQPLTNSARPPAQAPRSLFGALRRPPPMSQIRGHSPHIHSAP